MKKLENSIEATRYNPRDGKSTKIGKFKNDGLHEFAPPNSGENNDWLLVLDDVKAKELTDKGAELFHKSMDDLELLKNAFDEANTTPTTIEEFSHTFSYVYNMQIHSESA